MDAHAYPEQLAAFVAGAWLRLWQLHSQVLIDDE